MTKQIYAFWHIQFKSVKSATATKSQKSGAQELRKFLNGQTGLYHNILFLAGFNISCFVCYELLLGYGFLFPAPPSGYAIIF